MFGSSFAAPVEVNRSSRASKLVRTLALSAVAVLSLVSTAKADSVLSLPSAITTYYGTRGYVFTAPVSFTITGAQVLGASGTQYVEIVNVSHLALYPDTSTSYTVLNYSSGTSGSALGENIQVAAGDMIGVLGYDTGCGCVQYAAAGFTSSIFGNSVTLNRFLDQQSLTSPAGTVYGEARGNIGLVELSYSSGSVSATPEPSSFALLTTGLLGVGGAVRRRFRKA